MTSLDQIIERLKTIKPKLREDFGVDTIGVFGSVLRNDFKEDSSDIDIIVDFYKTVGIEFIDLGIFLETVLKRKVDLVSRRGVRSKYYKEIKDEIYYV